MELEDPRYQYPIESINHAEGAGRPAGIYLLNGVVRLAARRSAAERALRQAGAIYVATLCFEGSPYERTRPGSVVARVATGALFASAGEN
jgi:hypothetical protein